MLKEHPLPKELPKNSPKHQSKSHSANTLICWKSEALELQSQKYFLLDFEVIQEKRDCRQALSLYSNFFLQRNWGPLGPWPFPTSYCNLRASLLCSANNSALCRGIWSRLMDEAGFYLIIPLVRENLHVLQALWLKMGSGLEKKEKHKHFCGCFGVIGCQIIYLVNFKKINIWIKNELGR